MSTPFESLSLPAAVSISRAPVDASLPWLSADEIEASATMAVTRRAEFAHGRWHARRALTQLGVAEVSLPPAPDRAPQWPAGFVGSISHVPPDAAQDLAGQVVAVAARQHDYAGIGVDLERTGTLAPEHWPLFLTRDELAWLAVRPASERCRLAHGLWSAKEAVMKALRQPLDPQDIEIRVSDDERRFGADSRPVTGGDVVSVSGWLSFEPGWVLALATRPATMSAASSMAAGSD